MDFLVKIRAHQFPYLFSFIVWIGLHLPVHGQDNIGGIRIVSNFNGFEVGYAYPYITMPWKNRIVNREFNFGIQANYLIGKSYPSGNSLGLRPGITFASLGENTHLHTRTRDDGTISYSRTHVTDYKSLSLQLTGLFEFNLFSLKFGIGAFYSTPVVFSGTQESIEKGNQGRNNYTYNFSSAFRPNIGANAKLFIPIARSMEKEVFLSLEYLINANPTWETYTQEHWLMLSFIRRSLIIKEVRQKWDRYLIRKR